MVNLRQLFPSCTWSASSLGANKHLWPEGRGWLRIGPEDENARQVLALEWHMGRESRSCGLELGLNAVDGCGGVKLMLAIPWLFSVWFTVERVPRWLLPGHWGTSSYSGRIVWRPEQRNVGMRFFDWTVWVSLWENPMEWNRSDPWWWQFNVDLPDLVLGRAKFSKREVETGVCVVPMPESNYPAHYVVQELTWKRPRWPQPKRGLYIDIEVGSPEGIPLPGKGTTSYNCDDDACHAISMEHLGSVGDAVFEYAYGIVQDRIKRCGREVYP